jgi:hypothetical protein
MSPIKPKIASLALLLGLLAQLVSVCEESENMMNRTTVEDRLDGSSNFSSWKSRLQRDEDIKEEAFLFISKKKPSDLVKKETSLHVVLGDNARYNVKGVGTSTFQLDFNIPLQLNEVLYVPGMKRNLVSISALEDKGYKVTFSEGKVLAWHKDSHMNSTQVIGV